MSDLIKRNEAAIAKVPDAVQMLVNIAKTQNNIAQVAPKTPPVVIPEVLDVEIVEDGEEKPTPKTYLQKPYDKRMAIEKEMRRIPDRYAEKVEIHELPEVSANVKPRMTRSFVKLGILALEKEIEEGSFRQTFITESILIETIAAVANGQRTRQQLAEEMRKFLSEFGFYFIQWSVDDFFRFVDDARAELKKIS